MCSAVRALVSQAAEGASKGPVTFRHKNRYATIPVFIMAPFLNVLVMQYSDYLFVIKFPIICSMVLKVALGAGMVVRASIDCKTINARP